MILDFELLSLDFPHDRRRGFGRNPNKNPTGNDCIAASDEIQGSVGLTQDEGLVAWWAQFPQHTLCWQQPQSTLRYAVNGIDIISLCGVPTHLVGLNHFALRQSEPPAL